MLPPASVRGRSNSAKLDGRLGGVFGGVFTPPIMTQGPFREIPARSRKSLLISDLSICMEIRE